MALSISRIERTTAALEVGRIHYVSGRFFEAHEAWEAAWHEETDPMRRLLQGLIMAAGAYHKLADRRPSGMCMLLERALERLAPIPDGFAGLELGHFRAGLSRSLGEARAWSAGAATPSGPAPLAVVSTGGAAARRPA